MDYFTADLHLNHGNIIKQCNREFDNVEDMNEAIVVNCNKVVSPKDRLFIVGDVSLGKVKKSTMLDTLSLVGRLNGRKFLIRGNHDYKVTKVLSPYFEKVRDIMDIKVVDTDSKHGYNRVIMMHYALRTWPGQFYGSWSIYGHSHGNLPQIDNFSMDVGIDTHPEFRPYSYDEIKQKFASHKIYGEEKIEK